MSSYLKHLLRYIGSIYVALALLLILATYIALGTVLEGISRSHRFAAHYTYGNIFFGLLLAAFFANIAAAALNRWPWRKRHLPFLLAHLGLLLLLSGAIAQQLFGVQGSLLLSEGQNTNEFMLADSYAVKLYRRHGDVKGTTNFIFHPQQWKGTPQTLKCNEGGFLDLSVIVTAWHPHSASKLLSWVQNDALVLHSFPPLPLAPAHALLSQSPHHLSVGPLKEEWLLYAVKGGKLDLHLATLLTRHSDLLYFGAPLTWDGAKVTTHPPLSNQNNWRLSISHPALSDSWDTSFLSSQVELKAVPFLIAFVDNDGENLTFAGVDGGGRFFAHTLSLANPSPIYSYEDGWGGHRTRLILPVSGLPCDSTSRREARWHELTMQLRSQPYERLALPLQLYYAQCQMNNIDFAETFITFMRLWEQLGTDLCPIDNLSYSVKKVVDGIDWAFLGSKSNKECDRALIFSSALRHYGITPQLLLNCGEDEEKALRHYWAAHRDIEASNDDSKGELVLEATLKSESLPLPSLVNWEENRPFITCKIIDGDHMSEINLAYDKFGKGPMWPDSSGRYLARFQPLLRPLPFRLSLRAARVLFHPSSSQPRGYEADLWIDHVFTTLSMNKTWTSSDGLRLYLTNISPTSPQTVQITVSSDPNKFYLVYSGAFFLSLGLLFWAIKSPFVDC